jgi:hypothetical protein
MFLVYFVSEHDCEGEVLRAMAKAVLSLYPDVDFVLLALPRAIQIFAPLSVTALVHV